MGMVIASNMLHVHKIDLREIFECAHLKFTVYGRKHIRMLTHFRNAVPLVWGSLRLAPMTVLAAIYRKS